MDGEPVIRRLGERRRDLLTLTARRAAIAPLIMGMVTAAAFALAAVSPLDPLAAYLGDSYQFAGAETRDAAAKALGADASWWQAWWHWLVGTASGDAGFSHTYRQPVVTVLAERLPWTLLLSAAGLGAALLLAVAGGLVAALRPGGVVDRAVARLAVLASTVPTFVMALVVVAVFAVTWQVVPVSGAWAPGAAPTVVSTATHLVLPALVLAVSQLPWMLLTTRQAVLKAVESAPVCHARARGLSRWRVLVGHIGPVSWTPLIALVGARLPEVIVGALVVEEVFAWPGLAEATVDAALGADLPLLAAVTALSAAAIIAGTWLADCALMLADPRVRVHA
ncbi:ABC transporter permease [Dietzia cinnamea]|uniref:ABC transporter permease n=1 Tax=Dietzia TaxID=37914 RepID=UPI0020C31BFB|nr:MULTISPECIES: ABC transporter permease [Dietzia]MCT1884819.1 ABC transporter permease [Dietzia cinnamea]